MNNAMDQLDNIAGNSCKLTPTGAIPAAGATLLPEQLTLTL